MQKSLKTLFGTHHGLDDRSVEFLTGALSKNNLPGFDYIEFKQSLAALTNMEMDEETAFKSAFATAATVGPTKDKLLKTAEHYQNVLNKEKNQFDAALKKQVDQRVKSKQTEVAKLRKQVEDYRAKIQLLEEKINAAESTIEKADEVIQEAKNRIESTKDGFELTLQSILNEINKDIENIKSFL